MNILVTGASGFLGRHLVKRLQADNHKVSVLSTSECDLRMQGSLEKILRDNAFEQIFHLASWSRAGAFCREHPGEQIIVNQLIDINVLDYWKKKQPQAKLVAMGSSVAYDPELPLKEGNYLKGEPISDYLGYGHSKKMLFAELKAINREFGLNFMCFVPSTLYGADYHTDGRPMHFIYDLMRKIIRAKKFGDEVVLWGDGSQEREIFHVNDFVDVLLKINSRYENELVNVGSGNGIMIRDFAKMICQEIDYDFTQIKYDTTKPTGARSKYFDLTKMKTMYPEFKERDIRVGLKETINWMLEHPEIYSKK
jgi:GDP-L-fucose synthase